MLLLAGATFTRKEINELKKAPDNQRKFVMELLRNLLKRRQDFIDVLDTVTIPDLSKMIVDYRFDEDRIKKLITELGGNAAATPSSSCIIQ